MGENLWGQLKAGAASGVLSGGYPFAGNIYYVGANAPIFGKRAETVQDMLNLMTDRDVGFLGPGSYNEALVWPVGLDNVTLIGAGNRGDVSIAPSASNAIALVIEGTATRTQGVTLANIGLEGNGTGGGLHVKGNIRRMRFLNSKFEGGAFAVKLESNAAGAIGDTILDDVELCWATTALHLRVTGGGNPVTQTRLRNSLLHNYSSRGVFAADTFAADLWITKNIFARQEDGTEPTNQYISASIAGTTGFVAENSFATPTNAVAKLAVAAGVIWGPNGTEAGWSTARPA